MTTEFTAYIISGNIITTSPPPKSDMGNFHSLPFSLHPTLYHTLARVFLSHLLWHGTITVIIIIIYNVNWRGVVEIRERITATTLTEIFYKIYVIQPYTCIPASPWKNKIVKVVNRKHYVHYKSKGVLSCLLPVLCDIILYTTICNFRYTDGLTFSPALYHKPGCITGIKCLHALKIHLSVA